MKAYVFTTDKLSYSVLEKALTENLFSPVVQCPPTVERAKEMADVSSDSIILIDFDLTIAAEIAKYMPSIVTQLAFGSHNARGKATTAQINRFVVKPFTRAQLTMAIADTLRAEASLPEPGPVRVSAPLVPSAEIRNRWTQKLEAIGKRRAELDRLLSVSPEQLKVLLIAKVVIDSDGNPQVPAQDFPLRSVLVIEADPSNQRLIARYLAEKCVMQCDAASDGASAWKLLECRSYDAVILQWEAKNPSGLAIYNRLRTAPQTRYQPIIVISSTVKAQDFRLFDEDFAVALVPQPVQPKMFALALTKVVMTSVLAKESLEALVDLVSTSVEANYFADSKPLPANGNNTEILFSSLKIAGDRFLAQQRYDAAEAAYATAWKLGDRRLGLLTNYGRTCYLSGRSKEALKIMAMADVLAPNSVERLCMLGEINLEQKSLSDARSHFQAALAIDAEAEKANAGMDVVRAMEAQSKLSIAPDPSSDSPIANFASYMNLVGVHMARSGNPTDALRYYRSAMTFVHLKDDLAKLWFNVGLCHRRGNKQDLAKEAFQKCYTISGGTHRRAANYLQIVMDRAPKPAAAVSPKVLVPHAAKEVPAVDDLDSDYELF